MAKLKISGNDGLTTPETARILGVVLRTLQYWIATGLIKPALYPGGYGSSVVLSYWNLLELGVIDGLRSRGCSIQAIRRAIEYIERMGAKVYERKLVITPKDILDYGPLISEKEKSKIISLVEERGQLFLIDLRGIREGVDKKLRAKNIALSTSLT